MAFEASFSGFKFSADGIEISDGQVKLLGVRSQVVNPFGSGPYENIMSFDGRVGALRVENDGGVEVSMDSARLRVGDGGSAVFTAEELSGQCMQHEKSLAVFRQDVRKSTWEAKVDPDSLRVGVGDIILFSSGLWGRIAKSEWDCDTYGMYGVREAVHLVVELVRAQSDA